VLVACAAIHANASYQYNDASVEGAASAPQEMELPVLIWKTPDEN